MSASCARSWASRGAAPGRPGARALGDPDSERSARPAPARSAPWGGGQQRERRAVGRLIGILESGSGPREARRRGRQMALAKRPRVPVVTRRSPGLGEPADLLRQQRCKADRRAVLQVRTDCLQADRQALARAADGKRGRGLAGESGDGRVDEAAHVRRRLAVDRERQREVALVRGERPLDVRIGERGERGRQQHVPLPEELAPRRPVLLAPRSLLVVLRGRATRGHNSGCSWGSGPNY